MRFILVSLVVLVAAILISCRSTGLSSEDCLGVSEWRPAAQEYYFDINSGRDSENIWIAETTESFYESAKLTLPNPASKPESELLPLLEDHTSELEVIVFAIASSGMDGFLTKETEILDANENIRKINSLMVEECQLEPMILYEGHPQPNS